MADLNSTIVRGNLRVTEDINVNGTVETTNLILNPDPAIYYYPQIRVHNIKHNTNYLLNFPEYYDGAYTIATTSDMPVAGLGLSSSNGVFNVSTATESMIGGVKSSTTGTTANRDYKVQVNSDGTMKVNVPWTDTDTNTHYTNYLQIKGNGTEAVKFTQNADKSLNLKPGSNVSISASSGEITISATDTNTHNSHAIISGTKSDGSTQIKGSASSGDITLGDSGVTAGTYKSVTVNSKGIVIAGSQADNNTDTWRKVQLNGVDKLGTGTRTKPLNIKAGNNMTITESGGTFTFAASGGGGGITWDWIFQGAGELNGGYSLNGQSITIRGNQYKMLLFEINVNDVNFYLPIPTHTLSSSTYFYLAAGNTNNGAMGIVQVMASNSNFSASVSNGNLTLWNVNVYAYK